MDLNQEEINAMQPFSLAGCYCLRTVMKSKVFYTLLLLVFFSGGCDPCANLDCLSSNYHAQFRILSKDDGRDLVFGPDAVYDPLGIEFFALNGADTIFFQYDPIRFPNTGHDSILLVHFYPETTAPVFMRLNAADTDTLQLSYRTFVTKCCGTITEITKFRYNNSVDLPGSAGTQELRK